MQSPVFQYIFLSQQQIPKEQHQKFLRRFDVSSQIAVIRSDQSVAEIP
jgi:hypothetical protein